MKFASLPLIAASAAVFALAACQSPEEKAKTAAERPDSEGTSAAEIAARATTPQASMTPAEREEFRNGMVEMLDQAGQNRADGHVRVDGVEDQVVAMQPLQSHNFTVPMTQGVPYLIFAVCDGDCTVVDLSLVNSAGQVIKSDTDSGDFPVLDYTPTAAGTYTVRMTMAECKLAPCYAGARAYRKS
jgi:hypothetical protein